MPIGYTEQPTGVLDRCVRWMSRGLSGYSGGADRLPSAEALDGFRRAQKLAYETVLHVAGQLRPGMTEIEASEMLGQYLRERGSERYLHRPFAWFGNHTRFDEYMTYDDYHPSERTLARGACVILDVSPILNGYVGDVGYAFSLVPNPELEVAQEFLLELRGEIPKLFSGDMSPAEIWHEIDYRITQAGYDNIHSKYPFCTLGHRVFRLKSKTGRPMRFGRRYFGWFSFDVNVAFLRLGPSVTINAENVGTKLGLWAIEPHIGWQGGGAKFEEILVVEPGRSYWLDQDVPHVTQSRTASSEVIDT